MALSIREVAFVVLWVLVVGWHRVYFIILPQRAIRKYPQTDPERLRLYLERVIATPCLFRNSKLIAQEKLAEIYFLSGRHAQAAIHLRAIIKQTDSWKYRKGIATAMATFHSQLADCLEVLGKMDEAAEQCCLAENWINRAPDDTQSHLQRATLLKRQNRMEEAYAEYQAALEFAPQPNPEIRMHCLLQLCATAGTCGRPVECLRWADEVIAAGATGMHLRIAHSMSGVAYQNLGHVDESERHYRLAYEVAAAENDVPKMAEILGCLAGCLRQRGDFVAAIALCERSVATHASGIPASAAVRSWIHHDQGRYNDALAVLANANDTFNSIFPANKRKVNAVGELVMARFCCEGERANEAWGHLELAIKELDKNGHSRMLCEALRASIFAKSGDAVQSQVVARQLEPRLAEFARSPGTCRFALYDLGMAASARSDYYECIDCWTRFLSLHPDPVQRPTAHYFRGECHRNLHQFAEARSDYTAAADLNLDTHHTRLARRRLAELGDA